MSDVFDEKRRAADQPSSERRPASAEGAPEKLYAPPALTVFGKVEDLTQNSGVGLIDAAPAGSVIL